MNEQERRIRKIAHLLKVPAWLVKESVGIPLEQLRDFSFLAVKTTFIDADEGSEEQHVAREKMCAILMAELKSSSLLRTKTIYELSLEFELHEIKIEASHRWNDLSHEEVLAAKDYEQLSLAYERTHPGSGARRAASEKMAKWAERDFSKAKTFDQKIRACKNAPNKSEAKRLMIKIVYEQYTETGDGPALE